MRRWIRHFLGVGTRLLAVTSIRDPAWRWHAGRDVDATQILNALHDGQRPDDTTHARIPALFRLEFDDPGAVLSRVAGRPVHIGCSMTEARRLRLKPQNLLTNLPLRRT